MIRKTEIRMIIGIEMLVTMSLIKIRVFYMGMYISVFRRSIELKLI